MRILPRLDPERLRRDPKPIVGFSDATALLAWGHAAGVRGIHGPMIQQLGDLPDGDIAHLIALLTDPRPPGERPWRLAAHGGGVHRGPLVAGEPDAGVDARRHAVAAAARRRDRAVRGGRRAPVRARSLPDAARADRRDRPGRGGDRRRPRPLRGSEPARPAASIRRARRSPRCSSGSPPQGLPAATGAPVGHGARNEAVPFGATCELDLDRGVLTIIEAAVA